MQKLKLFLVFYKSTLTLSLAFALLVAVISGHFGFAIAFMTGGWMLSLYYKEVSHKNEYVYYRNMGISKFHLLLFSILFNILIGLVFIFAALCIAF